jgi:hypothetical protein
MKKSKITFFEAIIYLWRYHQRPKNPPKNVVYLDDVVMFRKLHRTG